jgi:hypothetical protein
MGYDVIGDIHGQAGKPTLQSPKVACVDYSAAMDGPMVAYRWDGESVLDESHFVEAQ